MIWWWVGHGKSNNCILLYYLYLTFSFFKSLIIVLCGFSAHGPSFSQKQRCSHSDRPYPDSHRKPRQHGGRVLQQPGYVSNANLKQDKMFYIYFLVPWFCGIFCPFPSHSHPLMPPTTAFPPIYSHPFIPTLSAHPSKPTVVNKSNS